MVYNAHVRIRKLLKTTVGKNEPWNYHLRTCNQAHHQGDLVDPNNYGGCPKQQKASHPAKPTNFITRWLSWPSLMCVMSGKPPHSSYPIVETPMVQVRPPKSYGPSKAAQPDSSQRGSTVLPWTCLKFMWTYPQLTYYLVKHRLTSRSSTFSYYGMDSAMKPKWTLACTSWC